MTQDWDSTSISWTPIESLVFTSALIPLNTEQISQPVAFTNSSNADNVSTSNNSNSPIITDITIEGGAEQYKTGIVYNPTAEYRIFSLIGRGEVREIDIQIYWKYRFTGQ
jgi:hypothetical protein